MQDLEQQIEPKAATPINRDFSPIAYYFDVVLWSSRFHSRWRDLLESLAALRFGAAAVVVFLGLLTLTVASGLFERFGVTRHRGSGDGTLPRDRDVRRLPRAYRATLGLSVAAMGFTLLGLEVLLLLGFQALYGYVYQQLAILVALFMVGMAGGAWLALSETRSRRGGSRTAPTTVDGGEYRKLALLQLLAAAAPLLVYALFVLLAGVKNLRALLTLNPMVFPMLALMAGLMGGFQFPVASRLYFSAAPPTNPLLSEEGNKASPASAQEFGNPGILYGLDLLGACLGALALSAYLLPVYGFLRTAVLMAAVNLGPAALAILAAFELRVHRTRAL
jgi:spermidine synthase